MNNVINFPLSATNLPEPLPLLSPEAIASYLIRYPDRVKILKEKLGYANQAAALLRQLLEDIDAEVKHARRDDGCYRPAHNEDGE
jgi:hypothetical protein